MSNTEKVSFFKRIEHYNREELLNIPRLSFKNNPHKVFQLFDRFLNNTKNSESLIDDITFLMNRHYIDDLNTVTCNGKSLAMTVKNEKHIVTLLNSGFLSYNFTDEEGNNLIKYSSIKLLKALDFNQLNLEYLNPQGQNALFALAIHEKNHSTKKLEFLMQKGYEINQQDNKGYNIIDHILKVDKWIMNYDDKEKFIMSLVKLGCQVSEIKEIHRMPKNWYNRFTVEEAAYQKKALESILTNNMKEDPIVKRRI